jgi:hypothetical protein
MQQVLLSFNQVFFQFSNRHPYFHHLFSITAVDHLLLTSAFKLPIQKLLAYHLDQTVSIVTILQVSQLALLPKPLPLLILFMAQPL